MRKTDPRTLQLWPIGDSVTVRGDSYGPKMEIKPNDLDGWRPATDEERRQVQIEEMAQGYQEQAVLCCDSALVDALLQQGDEMSGSENVATAFTYSEIKNLYPNPFSWDAEECKDWLEENREVPDDSEDYDEDDWRNAVTESAPDPVEIYEWWRIDSFLCDQLQAIGEPVIDNDYGEWWGRTCTGQGMIMDGTLQKVAAQFAPRIRYSL